MAVKTPQALLLTSHSQSTLYSQPPSSSITWHSSENLCCLPGPSKKPLLEHDDISISPSSSSRCGHSSLLGLPSASTTPPKAYLKTNEGKAKALLALSRYCQEQWVSSTIGLHLRRGSKLTMTLLSGDAGCGKSYAVSMLCKRLEALGVSCHVSAPTNKAAANLIESTRCKSVTTFHRMMGYKKNLIKDNLPTADFVQLYGSTYKHVIDQYKQLSEQPLDPQFMGHQRHPECSRPTPESCAECSRAFKKLKCSTSWNSLHSMREAPPFLGVNVLVVDEYGMLSDNEVDKMLKCLALFYGPLGGPLIVFAGSVSQLQPLGEHKPIWARGSLFESKLATSTPLFVNRRQIRDPGYSETITYLQFNTVTDESLRVLESRCNVTIGELMEPRFNPTSLRIFHSHDEQARYSKAFMKDTESRLGATAVAPVYLKLARNNHSKKSRFDALNYAAQVTPKLFAMPPFNPNSKPKEEDYLRLRKLWVGCRVGLLWYAGPHGIVHKDPGVYDVPQRGGNGKCAECVRDTEGLIVSIRHNSKKKWYEFTVQGLQSGKKYVVSPTEMDYLGWTVCTHPLSCLVAMNTHECQGCTVRGDVLYHPPFGFDWSEMKPSVYVALSRVLSRENIRITNCKFTSCELYPWDLVEYRKRVEMAYIASDKPWKKSSTMVPGIWKTKEAESSIDS